MIVAHFASAFHPSLGGVEEMVRSLAHTQEEQGDQPIIITNRYPATLPEEETFEGLQVRRFRFRVPGATWRHMAGALLYARGTLNTICEEVQSRKIDVINVHCVSSNAYYAVRVKQRLRIPLIVTVHGELTMDANRLYQRSSIARSHYRDALKNADVITACSGQTLAEAQDFYGQSFGSRGKVIHNGVVVADFQSAAPYAHPRPYVLAMGRMVHQKGFDILLDAFNQSGITSHDLLIAGDGPDFESLKDKARRSASATQIHFLGRMARTQVTSLFKGCSFFVLPSRHEPMGIVNLEAMAAGRPVLAANVGGVPEFVIDNQTGLLFPKEDTQALSNRMRDLAASGDLRDKLGSAGFIQSQKFDWKEIAKKYRQVYDSAVARVS